MHDVAIVGAGPVGTLLAGLLTREGLSVEVLERRTDPSSGTRAIGLHAPVLAALESSGLTDALLARALRVHSGEARSAGKLIGTVRFARLSARFPFVATLPQQETQAILQSIAPQPRRGETVTRIVQGADRIVLHVTDKTGATRDVAARIAVVAAGGSGRDLVFRGGTVPVHTYRDRYVMADVAAESTPVAVVDLDGRGVLESFPLPGGQRRFVAWDPPHATSDPDAAGARLADALTERGLHDVADRVSRATTFGVRRCIAPELRRGRLFVVGDTAHEVSPIGGQGMNLGLLDVATLAPLLAGWIRHGISPDTELRHWERRRVGSARIGAMIASANTRLGRPMGPVATRARRIGLGIALGSPLSGLLAKAYSMGLDHNAG